MACRNCFFLLVLHAVALDIHVFLLNGLFITITSLLKLISLIFGCILILYLILYFYCTYYVFYFTIISLTSGSNHVWNSHVSTCKHLNLHNCIISKFLSYLYLILLQHVDSESNPGPDRTKLKNFSCCHWSLNSLVAHNFSKLCQLEAYKSLYNYNFTCISETYLDSSVM